MKTAYFLILSLLSSFIAKADVCEEYYHNSTFKDFEELLYYGDSNGKEKQTFKRRNGPNASREIIRIESNFKVPMAGKDPYFGRIYIGKDASTIRYRDELIAEERYEDEQIKNSSFYTSTYKVSDINSSAGLSLLKAAGASVTIKSKNKKFNTKSGGSLSLSVKHPIDGTFTLNLSITITNGVARNSVEINGKSYAFDTLKINASSFGIATGIKNIEFSKNGKVTHTFEP